MNPVNQVIELDLLNFVGYPPPNMSFLVNSTGVKLINNDGIALVG